MSGELYVRGYSFAGYQATAPQTPLPAQRVDIELDNISAALVKLQRALAATTGNVQVPIEINDLTDAGAAGKNVLAAGTNSAARAALGLEGETTLASAATVDIGAAPTTRVLMTGSSSISSLGSIASQERLVRFAGSLTLTNGAALILPGGANIVTAADDVARFVSDGAGAWRCIDYQRASGRALVGPFRSIADFGGKGDGTDATAAFSAAIAASPVDANNERGAIVYVPAGKYLVSSQIVVNKPLTLLIDAGATIVSSVIGAATFRITSSNVHVRGLGRGAALRGPRVSDLYVAAEYGVFFDGSGGALGNVSASDIDVSGFSSAGVYMLSCQDFFIEKVYAQNIGYIALCAQSCQRGRINANRVQSVKSSNGPGSATAPVNTQTNAYGITATWGPLPSSDVFIYDNVIDDVPTWSGIDTHGGTRISIFNNHCTNVRQGVTVTTNGAGVNPQDVSVFNNRLSAVAVGTAIPGGASAIGGVGVSVWGTGVSSYAVNCSVAGNTVRGFGGSNAAQSHGAIDIDAALGVHVDGNNVASSRLAAYRFGDYVFGSVHGGVVTDVALALGKQSVFYSAQTHLQIVLGGFYANVPSATVYDFVAPAGSYWIKKAVDNGLANHTSLGANYSAAD